MPKVDCVCPVCGAKFQRYPANLKRVKYTVVCSRACLYKGRSLGIIKREVQQPYQVTEEGRQAWRDAASQRVGQLRKPPIAFTCETCGEEVLIPRGKSCPARQFRFCSHGCANIGARGAGNPAWRGGHERYYGPDWRSQRKAARKRDNYTCQRCSKTTKEAKRSLDVHHKTPFNQFASYEEANQLENLVTLCHPCHQYIEWNGIDF